MRLKPIVRAGFCLLCLTVWTWSGLAQSGTRRIIRTVAGNGGVVDGGPAASASLKQTLSVAVDAEGNVFIADYVELSESTLSAIRKVTPGGVITRPLFTADDSELFVAVDAAGNLYTADSWQHKVVKVAPDGAISTVAGNGKFGFDGDGGPATLASLRMPSGVAVDVNGNIYVADTYNFRVRKITSDGTISTVAGNGIAGVRGDCGPTSGLIFCPYGLAVDRAGTLFIADAKSHIIRRLTPDGVMQTVAGNGSAGFSGDGGPATSAQLNFPYGLAVDADGNLYIADRNNHRVREVTRDGVIRTIVGNGIPGFAGDGGPPESAQLAYPWGLAVDAGGNLYIADSGNHRIRKVENRPEGTRGSGALRYDFSGDGSVDILWRDTAGSVSMWLMSGFTIVDNRLIANVWPGWTVAGSGDFNGDGKSDVLWRDGGENVAIWLMDGTTIASYGYIQSMPKEWAIAGIADFDGDGRADIVWRDAAGDVLIWVVDGYRVTNHSFVAKIWPEWRIAGTGDFDGDGKADILWRDSLGNVSIWLMDGVTISSYSHTGNMPRSAEVGGVGDFDGDGRADILWRDATGSIAMWLMNGHTVLNNSFIASVWSGWTIAGTGDFNGDRRLDILWRDNAGDVSIWLMEGTAVSAYKLMGNVSDLKAQ